MKLGLLMFNSNEKPFFMLLLNCMKKLLFIPIIFSFLIVGAVQAQTTELPTPNTLPGDTLYFLSTAAESIGSALTFGAINKANRQIDLADKRVAEAKALAENNKPDLAEKSAARYEKHLAKALKKAEKAKAKGKNTDDILARITESTLKHQSVLLDVYERVPEKAKAAIEKALQKSARGHEQAMNNVSSSKKEEAKKRVEQKKLEIKQKLESIKNKGGRVPNLESNDEDGEES